MPFVLATLSTTLTGIGSPNENEQGAIVVSKIAAKARSVVADRYKQTIRRFLRGALAKFPRFLEPVAIHSFTT